MSMVIPDAGALHLLPITIGLAAFDSSHWQLHLYQNNYTPGAGTTPVSFTESTFTGYSQFDIVPSAWTSPTTIAGAASSTMNSGSSINWTNTGSAQDVYGYYVTDYGNTVVLFAEKFSSVRTLNTGDTLQLTVPFTGKTQ